MSEDAASGRLLRAGRTITRFLLTWGLGTAALVVLDRALTGFAMDSWWQPPVLALVLGLLAAVAWPLVIRIALPLAFFTLGLGGFLLMGAGVLALSFAIPGVVVAHLSTAVLLAVTLAGVAAVVTSVLAIDEDEVFFRRTRRRARHAGPPDADTPGVLFLEIDGLGYDTVRRAVRDG